MQRGFSAKLAALLLCIAGAAFYGSLSSSASTPKPIESGFKVSPNVVGNGGGFVLLSAKVSNGTKCIFLVSPAVPGFAYNHLCSSGIISYKAILPKNTSTSKKVYSFRIEVKGKAGQATVVSPTVTATVNASAASGGGSVSTIGTLTVPAGPDALLQIGNNIWVASCSGNALTEISKTTKQITDTLVSSIYGFNCPDALAFDGTNIWVANKNGNSLTQINLSNIENPSVITGSYIYDPLSIVVTTDNNGKYIWVGCGNIAPSSGGFLSKFSTSGRFLKAISVGSNYSYAINDPESIAFDGTNIWEADPSDNSANEFNNNGIFLRNLKGSNVGPAYVTYSSGYIWITGSSSSTVVEYNKSAGIVRTVLFAAANQIIFNGNRLFIASDSLQGNYVEEFNASGKPIKLIAKPNVRYGKNISSILDDGSNLWVSYYDGSLVAYYPI